MNRNQLKNKRVVVPNAKISENVQKKAFELGFRWNYNGQTVSNTERSVLYFENDGSISHGDIGHTWGVETISWQRIVNPSKLEKIYYGK